MLKMKSALCIQIAGRDYEFNCAPDSPLNDAIEANNQFAAFLLGKQAQAQNAQQPQPPAPEPEAPTEV